MPSEVKQIESRLLKQAWQEESPARDEILDSLFHNGLIRVTKTREDHRYHQGYLQALDELRVLFHKPVVLSS